MKKSLIDVFVEGARKGLHINLNNIIPNLVMAFVLIQILKITGLLGLCGMLFSPVMAVFGLPGEGITVLLSTWLAMGGGVGATASLYAEGILTEQQVTILMPALFLMGAQAQYMGRLLGTAGVPSRHYPMLLAISILNACCAMLVMRLIA